jgi:hypothetical protein
MPEQEIISRAMVEELPELRQFLVEGFGGDESAVCFDEGVLRWKYFLPIGNDSSSRSLIVRHEGKILGHIGMCPREFYVPGKGRISTVHFIDWLASREHPLVGVTVMMRGCEMAQTQYGVGGSAQGRAMLGQLGYEQVGSVGDYVRVISPGYRLRSPGGGMRKYAAAMRDAGRVWGTRVRKPGVEVEVRRVEEFGEEVERVVGAVEYECVFTSRDSDLLNYYLRFPLGKGESEVGEGAPSALTPALSQGTGRGGKRITGWTICLQEEVRGFALLGIFEEDGAKCGRIIECFLSSAESQMWHAAVWALVRELKSRDVEIISCYASSPWLREGLEGCGFYLQRDLPLTLRDGEGLVPRDLPFHLTRLEGDYAYL